MPDKAEFVQYVPGVCNLGKQEIRRRYRIGFMGLTLAILLGIFFVLNDTGPAWKWLVIIPLFYGLSGFIQAQRKFCYIYGLRHGYSLEGKKKFTKIYNEDFIKADRNTAIRIVFMALLESGVVTIAYYILT